MKESRRSMAKRMEEHLQRLEQLHLADYLRYAQDTRRLIRTQFLGGLFRGLGMAVGFTILGAVLILVLNTLAQRNLPIIGDLLTQIMEIVRNGME